MAAARKVKRQEPPRYTAINFPFAPLQFKNDDDRSSHQPPPLCDHSNDHSRGWMDGLTGVDLVCPATACLPACLPLLPTTHSFTPVTNDRGMDGWIDRYYIISAITYLVFLFWKNVPGISPESAAKPIYDRKPSPSIDRTRGSETATPHINDDPRKKKTIA